MAKSKITVKIQEKYKNKREQVSTLELYDLFLYQDKVYMKLSNVITKQGEELSVEPNLTEEEELIVNTGLSIPGQTLYNCLCLEPTQLSYVEDTEEVLLISRAEIRLLL